VSPLPAEQLLGFVLQAEYAGDGFDESCYGAVSVDVHRYHIYIRSSRALLIRD
jgi:hypothetical protein